MSGEPENMVLALLREMRGEMAEMRGELTDMRGEMATKGDIADVRSEIKTLRADVASDLMTLEKRLGDQIVGLRRAVIEYHSSQIGHGVLLTEFEERLRRLEQHVGLPPEAH